MSTKSYSFWRIAKEAAAHRAADLSGNGGLYASARWHRKGTRVVYASTLISLAALELLAHHRQASQYRNMFLVRIDVADSVTKKAQRVSLKSLAAGWQAVPPGVTSTQCGDDWLKAMSSAMLFVPSAIVPEEENILINPLHPDVDHIRATAVRPFLFDPRIQSTS
jgi:RES domain-containing protein